MPEGKPLKKLKRKKVVQPDGVSYPELENVLQQMYEIQKDKLESSLRFLQLEAWAIKFIEDHRIEKYDRGPLVGTPVGGSTAEYDWDAIRRAIGPKLWTRILGEPQPDPNKLAALVELDIVKAADIDPLIKDKPKKKYLKITRKG